MPIFVPSRHSNRSVDQTVPFGQTRGPIKQPTHRSPPKTASVIIPGRLKLLMI